MLYHWKSAFMADHLDGDIIVAATSLEDARSKARAAFEARYASIRAKDRCLFEADIAAEPTITDAAILLSGSA